MDRKNIMKAADAADNIYRLRKERQAIQVRDAERDGKRQRFKEMKAFLEEQVDIPAKYDEQLARQLIERVTVFDEKITVRFKSGVKINSNFVHRLLRLFLAGFCLILLVFAESSHNYVTIKIRQLMIRAILYTSLKQQKSSNYPPNFGIPAPQPSSSCQKVRYSELFRGFGAEVSCEV